VGLLGILRSGGDEIQIFTVANTPQTHFALGGAAAFFHGRRAYVDIQNTIKRRKNTIGSFIAISIR
jgi:hypothetical protein